jgi:Carboxypeptidase regulatory-like domain/Putative Flp pilus-assembly TadE/G-like
MRPRARTSRPASPGETPLGSRRGDVKGQILVLFAFVLVALLVVSALAVDYGGWLLARRTYQNVADAAALAGASQLTTPITELSCPLAGAGGSKNACAREAAWASLKDSLGLSVDPAAQALGPQFNLPYVDVATGYKVWVASPPSDAGAKYPGSVSSQRTIFVWVERVESANLSHIVMPNGQTVSAWATAGRIPQDFAFVGLCYPSAPRIGTSDCHTGTGEDITVNGGSTIVIEQGDAGLNTWAKTNGGSVIALGADGGAYMGSFANCWSNPVQCKLAGWTGPEPGTISGTRSAIPLGPRIQDPGYPEPTINSTTIPYQCYTNGSQPAVSSIDQPVADGQTLNDAPIKLTSLQEPQPTSNPLLGSATATGTVTAVVGGAGLNGITVTLTGPSNPAPVITAKVGAVNGKYTISNVTPAGSYTLTATDTGDAGTGRAAGTYHTYTQVVTVPASGTLTTSFAMNENPVISGTVKDASTGTGIVGAIVTVTGLTGGPFTATSTAGGAYTMTVTNAGTFNATGSAANYASQTYLTNTASLDATTTLNFSLNPNAATIHGTVTGTGGVGLVGATVTVVGVGFVATTAGGAYTIGVPGSATYTVTASAPGYTTASQSSGFVGPGGSATVNFALVASSTITGTVTDGTTGLPIPLVVSVTVASGPTPGTTTTNPSGVYSLIGLSAGTYTLTVSSTGYTSTTTANIVVGGGATVTQNISLWPARCGTNNSTFGKWDCGYGAGGCPTVNNPTGGNVTCSVFDNTNRIRPGTYKDITIAANSCAWIDPRGDPTGLNTGQSPGIVHVTDNISLANGAFLFGDGVTIVMDSGSSVTFHNGAGFVLNYGTKYISGACDLTTPAYQGDTKCFRRVPGGGNYDGNDYSYGAYMVNIKTKATFSPYTTCGASTPAAYNLSCFSSDDLGHILGITWYLRGLGDSSRFNFSGQMGFLFNGILYGPKDNIAISGQGAQNSAGQIIGWTITYSGGTTLYHRYAGIVTDGPPYLVEPFLGQ